MQRQCYQTYCTIIPSHSASTMKKLSFILVILLAATSLRAATGSNFDPPLPPDPGPVFELTMEASIPEAATLTGAGLYDANKSITVTCATEEGYRFDYWSAAGERLSTSSSYTFQMPASNLHLTAHITALSKHTLTVNTSVDSAAVVTGQGEYFPGQAVQITCTMHKDYTFQHWTLDGQYYSNKRNHTFTTTDKDQVLTAVCTYTPVRQVIVRSNSTKTGTVSTSGGTYSVGHTLTIRATPKTEYIFSHWERNGQYYSDQANINYTVTEEDAELVAFFLFSPAQPDDPATELTSTIYIVAEPQNAATFNIQSGKKHPEGDTLYISAQLRSNYVLDGWYINDQCVSNTLEVVHIVGRKDATLTLRATEIRSYPLTLVSLPSGVVSFNRSSQTNVKASETIQLNATVKNQYMFDGWYEADSLISTSLTIQYQMPNRAVTLTAKASAINNGGGFDPLPPAEPELEKVYINAYPDNATMGKVTGAAMHVVGDTITLEAIPYTGYQFVRWSDYDTNPIKTIIVSEDITLVAYFKQATYQLQVSSSDETKGTVTGSGNYPYLSYQTIKAIPNTGYEFVRWSNGSTDQVYTLQIKSDSTLIAEFQEQEYHLNVSSSNAQAGYVTGAGTYHYGETAIITATPNTGYNFLQWSDGDTHISRQIVVTNNITLVAFFTAQQFDLILTSEAPAMGYVIGEGKYDYATELTIQAIPYKGYQFLQWSNGITDNPYTFVLTEHTTLVASFIEDRPTAISNTPSPITNCQKIIYNAQLLIIRDGKTYNAMGQEL